MNPFILDCRRYAGIGSRGTPPAMQALIRRIGRVLALRGLVLCSGGAQGADAAFEAGCDAVGGRKEIYLPWRGFNGHPSLRCRPSAMAEEVAEGCHPNWAARSRGARLLHARNVQQVYGEDLAHPVDFVVLWAELCGAGVKGGTATAVRLAEGVGIPVFNLRLEGVEGAFRRFVEEAEG